MDIANTIIYAIFAAVAVYIMYRIMKILLKIGEMVERTEKPASATATLVPLPSLAQVALRCSYIASHGALGSRCVEL